MTAVYIKISDELHRKLKVYTAKKDTTITELVVNFLEKELKNEQTQ